MMYTSFVYDVSSQVRFNGIVFLYFLYVGLVEKKTHSEINLA